MNNGYGSNMCSNEHRVQQGGTNAQYRTAHGDYNENFKTKRLTLWTIDDTSNWLKSNNWHQWVAEFRTQECCGETLADLTRKELAQDILGGKGTGTWRKMMKQISEYKRREQLEKQLEIDQRAERDKLREDSRMLKHAHVELQRAHLEMNNKLAEMGQLFEDNLRRLRGEINGLFFVVFVFFT